MMKKLIKNWIFTLIVCILLSVLSVLSVLSELLELLELPPHATRESTIISARSSAANFLTFFMFILLIFQYPEPRMITRESAKKQDANLLSPCNTTIQPSKQSCQSLFIFQHCFGVLAYFTIPFLCFLPKKDSISTFFKLLKQCLIRKIDHSSQRAAV